MFQWLKVTKQVAEIVNRTHDVTTEHFNEKRQEPELREKDLVLEWKRVGESGLTTKFLKQWKVPIVSEQNTNPVNFKIRPLSGRKAPRIVYVERMKLFNVREDDKDALFWVSVSSADRENPKPATSDVLSESHLVSKDPVTEPALDRATHSSTEVHAFRPQRLMAKPSCYLDICVALPCFFLLVTKSTSNNWKVRSATSTNRRNLPCNVSEQYAGTMSYIQCAWILLTVFGLPEILSHTTIACDCSNPHFWGIIETERVNRCTGPIVGLEEIGVVEYAVVQQKPESSRISGFAYKRLVMGATVDTFWTFATDHQTFQRTLETSSTDCWRIVQTKMRGTNEMGETDGVQRFEGTPAVIPRYLRTVTDEEKNCLVEAIALEAMPGSTEVWSATGNAVRLGITFVRLPALENNTTRCDAKLTDDTAKWCGSIQPSTSVCSI